MTDKCAFLSLLLAAVPLIASKDISGEYKPRFVKSDSWPLFHRVYTGATVELRCKSRGKPTPNIKWLKNGRKYEGLDRKPVKPEFKRWNLKLPEIVVKDAGNYACVVSNKHGSINWTYQLDVIYRKQNVAPVVVSTATNYTVYQGDNVSLPCKVVDMSDSFPHLLWVRHFKKNGTWMDTNNRYHVKVVKDSSMKDKTDIESLTFTNISYGSAGWYTCIVSNQYGRVPLSHWIYVVPAPNTTALPRLIYNQETTPISMKNPKLYIPVSVMSGAFIILVMTIIAISVRYLWRRKSKAQPTKKVEYYSRGLTREIIQGKVTEENCLLKQDRIPYLNGNNVL